MIDEYNNREFMGRSSKVKPGIKQGNGGVRSSVKHENASERKYVERRCFHTSCERTRLLILESLNSTNRWNMLERPESIIYASKEGRRLFVGGLPRFKNNAETVASMRELFGIAGVFRYSMDFLHSPANY